MGGSMGGGQQATPPKLDVAGTLKLNRGQAELFKEYLPQINELLSDQARSQNTQNTIYGLNLLTRPNQTLRQEQIAPIRENLQKTRGKIKDLRAKFKAGDITEKQFRNRLGDLQDRAKRQRGRIADIRETNPLQQLTQTFSKEFGQRDQLLGEMGKAIPSSAEYRRLQGALGAGLSRGELGESLYQTALERAQSQGQLTPQAERDAVQAARSGMAARGMATGSAGLGAELLNRDAYSRARMAEDLAFAGGVQASDQARRQYNIGLLADSANYADAERQRQLGMRQNIYNFGLSSNPRMMLAGLGSPYANMTQPATSTVAGLTANVNPQYWGGQFSSGGIGGGLMGAGMGAAGGALSGAALGSVVPGIGTATGAVVGGLVGGFGGFAGGMR